MGGGGSDGAAALFAEPAFHFQLRTAPNFIVESPRLGFRFWRGDDGAAVLRIFSDPETVRFIGGKTIDTEEGARAFLIKAGMKEDGRRPWHGADVMLYKAVREEWGKERDEKI